MEMIYSLGQVAKKVGVQPYRISYAIQVGQLPEASFRFLDKRCFTENQVHRIAEFFGIDLQVNWNQSEKGTR